VKKLFFLIAFLGACTTGNKLIQSNDFSCFTLNGPMSINSAFLNLNGRFTYIENKIGDKLLRIRSLLGSNIILISRNASDDQIKIQSQNDVFSSQELAELGKINNIHVPELNSLFSWILGRPYSNDTSIETIMNKQVFYEEEWKIESFRPNESYLRMRNVIQYEGTILTLEVFNLNLNCDGV
jgi:outer membrane biogenesis lipoprotein LolB